MADLRFDDEAEKLRIANAMERLSERLAQTVLLIESLVGAYQRPPAIEAVEVQLAHIERNLRQARKAAQAGGESPLFVPEELTPLVAAALIRWRAEKAQNLESAYSKVVDRRVVAHLATELQTLDELVSQPWMQETTPLKVPELIDFVTLEVAANDTDRVAERRYDEKFHTLQAPDLRWSDIAYFRRTCGLRGLSLGVAFVDIDDFKSFNTKYGESMVDVNLLPTFMRALEAACFGRGYAYRLGGDEYLLCLPNVDALQLEALLERIRATAEGLEYEDIEGPATVSIGYVIVGGDCPLTDHEVITRAQEAKNGAKNAGKNAVAGYPNGRFDTRDLLLFHRT